jgi:hypothetical protein
VWIPLGDRQRTLMGTGNNPYASLQGIDAAELLKAVPMVLNARKDSVPAQAGDRLVFW